MGRSGWLVGGLLWLSALGIRFLLYRAKPDKPLFVNYPLVDAKTYTDAAERMGVTGAYWDGGKRPLLATTALSLLLGFLYAPFTQATTYPASSKPPLAPATASYFTCSAAACFLLV